jgi:acetyl esterase/lipase
VIEPLAVIACLALVACVCAVEPAAATRQPLWGGNAPDGGSDSADAFITIHRPAQANGTAVVICPGGGYGVLCVQPEGTGIATWLGRHGITGVVLEYRLPRGRARVPLLDAQRAIRTVRARAGELGLDPARIGIMGFSAGGHLASTAATHVDAGDANATDPLARVGCRPDFAILVYPVISMGPEAHAGSRQNLLGDAQTPELMREYSNELQVTAATPPTYLAHARDDTVVAIANSRSFAAACEQAGVPVRLLELATGGHGLNGYQGPGWDAWQSGSLAWLAERGLVPAATR